MENFNDTLDSIEKSLKENTINEGQYIKLMEMAKKRFEKQTKNKENERDVIEIYTHNNILFGKFLNPTHGNFVVINLIEYEEDNSTGFRNFLRKSEALIYFQGLSGLPWV